MGGFDVNVAEARKKVKRLIERGFCYDSVRLPLTPRAKRVLELYIEEAIGLGPGYVGTEHMLLALLEDEVGIGLPIREQWGELMFLFRLFLIEKNN